MMRYMGDAYANRKTILLSRLLLPLRFLCDHIFTLRLFPNPREPSPYVLPISISYTLGILTSSHGVRSSSLPRKSHTFPLSPNSTTISSMPSSLTSTFLPTALKIFAAYTEMRPLPFSTSSSPWAHLHSQDASIPYDPRFQLAQVWGAVPPLQFACLQPY